MHFPGPPTQLPRSLQLRPERSDGFTFGRDHQEVFTGTHNTIKRFSTLFDVKFPEYLIYSPNGSRNRGIASLFESSSTSRLEDPPNEGASMRK